MVITARLLLLALAIFGVANANDAKVVKITTANFPDVVNEHKFLVVEFYAPWCGHCKALEPEWNKAAEMLDGDMSAGVPITLAKVDGTEEKDLASKYEVTGFPTIKIFRNGNADAPVEFDGPRAAAPIVDYLLKMAGPPSTLVTDIEVAAKAKESERVIVVYAGDKLNQDQWQAVTDPLRTVATFFHVTDKKVMAILGVNAGITMLKKFDEPSMTFDGKITDTEKLSAWINTNRFELGMHVKKGDMTSIKIVFEDDSRPNVFLFTSSEKGLEEFKQGVVDTRGKIVSGYFEKDNFPEAFQHFGMDKVMDSDLPKVMIEDRKAQAKYMMKDAVTKDAVKQFLVDFQAGKIEPHVKSEEIPTGNSGPVKKVVGLNVDQEVVNAGKWVFLKAYAPWCGHCKTIAPVWEDLGKAFKDDDSIVMAEVDATANDLPPEWGVKGFPTLLLFKGNGKKPTTYEHNDRSFDALNKFIVEVTGAKSATGFKPRAPPPPPSPYDGVPLDKIILSTLATTYQVPWMSEGYKVSGLYIAAICIFLVFVASIALVVACLSREGKPPAPAGETKKTK